MRCVLCLTLSCLLAGCGMGYKSTNNESRPERATGMGATVIYPGQAGPGMPGMAGGNGGGTSSSSSQPGSSSGSSSASGAPAPGGNITMISGGKEENSSSTQEKAFPAPGLLLGYPFWIFGKSLSQKADRAADEREAPRIEAADGQMERIATPDDAERARIVHENERLRNELARQARESNPARQAAGGGSIADELAALERARSARAAPGATHPPTPSGRALPHSLTPPRTADRNRDGRPDMWTYSENGRPTREMLDDDYDGRPDRTLYYDEQRRVARTEDDLDGDGTLETITLYEAGQMSRRRSDSDADGQSDAWSFYRDGELVRNERDRDGDGFRDLVLSYSDGELTREEEDRNGDGRPDVVSVYRKGELAEKREDIDFDGKPDVESFYERGKLVRRNLNSEQVFEEWTPGGDS